jgi:hypothetical protein
LQGCLANKLIYNEVRDKALESIGALIKLTKEASDVSGGIDVPHWGEYR